MDDGVAHLARMTPRDAMLLYRRQRLLEDEQETLQQGGIALPQAQPAAPLTGQQKAEQVHGQLGEQDEQTAENRQHWRTLQEGLAGDARLDAEQMAALYLRVPGQNLPPPQNVIQSLAEQRKVQVAGRRRIQHKPGATRGQQGLHAGLWRTSSGQPVTAKGRSNVLHRTHLPTRGSVAIV